MALKNKSLFNYGLEVTTSNRFITFGTNAGETVLLSTARLAQLNLGFYSLTSLMVEIVRALTAADPNHVYTVTANRNISGGLQNRVTIATSGSYLVLYFGTGNPSNVAPLIGFNSSDYTSATTYTGSASAGTVLVPKQLAYQYLPIEAMRKNYGVQTISAGGIKQSITFSVQKFWQAQFKYIPEADLTSWQPLVDWMILQREFEFTPDITTPNSFYAGTLEEPNKGMELTLTEMLPQFPFNYQTPVMKFRLRLT